LRAPDRRARDARGPIDPCPGRGARSAVAELPPFACAPEAARPMLRSLDGSSLRRAMTDRPRFALRFISGKYQGGEFPLRMNREIIIGRSSDLDMVLVE